MWFYGFLKNILTSQTLHWYSHNVIYSLKGATVIGFLNDKGLEEIKIAKFTPLALYPSPTLIQGTL